MMCGVLMGAGLMGAAVHAASPPSTAPTQSAAEPKTTKVAIRRMTESQYRHTIADTFGSDIKINARFEPEKRDEGLLAIGTPQLSLTSSGFEQYFALASSLIDQALNEKQRDKTVGCKPADAAKVDDTCARQVIPKYGERFFRRPLTEAETTARLNAVALGVKQTNDFYVGLKLALTSLLVAPEFLFRVEMAEPDPANPSQQR